MRKSRKIFSMLLVLILLLMTGMSSAFAQEVCGTCGGDGHIVDPCDPTLTCDCPHCYYYDETAWARDCGGVGVEFGEGRNWATIIQFNVNGPLSSYALYAGQNDHVGFINVSRVGGYLRVEYVLFDDDLEVTEAHLMAVDDGNISDLPNKNGNLIPGKFTIKGNDAGPYYVPFTDDGDGIVVLAVHAVVEGWICMDH